MKCVTAVLVGAGLRGAHVYSQYALDHPDELKVVAVAEPDRTKRERFAAQHGIGEEMQFTGYDGLFSREKLADCAMICTQDRMHYEPVKLALERGYHVLCEKPMSPDKKEIVEMGALAGKYGRILSVCHVLRYSPFFSRIKELLDEGRIGRLMTIQHIEEVGYWHHAHSFVRGNWRNAEESSPMILQKCCHDMDILLWLCGSRCTRLSSFGALTYFRRENAPADAPEYCMDGCAHRETCPFYAPRFYLEHERAVEDGLVYAVLEQERAEVVEETVEEAADPLKPEVILGALRRGPYGRCVFHCDNTVVDHQTVDMEFENGVTASFLMTAFTNQCARRIRLMGTKGELKGDMEAGVIEVIDFASGEEQKIQLHTPSKGHSGSDERMMQNFVRMVSEGTSGRTDAAVSVESHLMALAAEEARVSGRVVRVFQSA